MKKPFKSTDDIESDRTTPGVSAGAINIQIVLAFREISCGYSAISTFCQVMNMEPPMSISTYRAVNEKFTKLN